MNGSRSFLVGQTAAPAHAAADADIARHTGMIRIGNLPASRWCMVPALASTRQIVGAIMGAS
jgi:hypothetical protein